MTNPDDIKAFASLMTQMAALYPHNKPDIDQVIEAYFEDLQHLSLDQVRAVFVLARRRAKFFPTITELLQIAGDSFDSPPLLPPRSKALEAWHALRSLSGLAYREAALDDPITHHVFHAMGGRAFFGTWDYDRDEARMRQYFCDLYHTYLLREAQYVSHEEAERILKSSGYDHLFGGHWLGAGKDDDDDDPVS